MRVKTRPLFAVILLAQIACVAVGLTFHHLYMSSAVLHAEEDVARTNLTKQLRAVTASLGQCDLASLQDDSTRWQAALDLWRATAERTDVVYLLDAQGRVVRAAAFDDQSAAPARSGESLTLTRSNADWGRFGDSIRGVLRDSRRGDQVVLGGSLGMHDGYLLMTRDATTEDVAPAAIQAAQWAADGITLLWTIALQAATLFMIVTHFKQAKSRDVVQPEVEALKQAQTLVRTQETVIFALAKLSDSRDSDTGSHLERIAFYSSALAGGLRQHSDFREQITSDFVQLIGISSALHDIGKVGVEDSILLKPGKLSADERSRMQCHTKIGEDCLKEIERRLGSSNFLQMAREIASAHHERWDGEGYPSGLVGEQIPLAARIVALADVYDALSRKRVYKKALSHEQCVAMIAEESGKHFDPRIVEVFLQIQNRFRQISLQFNVPAKSSNAATNRSASPGGQMFLADSAAIAATPQPFEDPAAALRPSKQ